MSSYFDADVARVFVNMTDKRSNHYRTEVHPIFSVAAYLPVKAMDRFLGVGDRKAVAAVQALVAGVWAAAFSALLLMVLPGLVDAVLFVGLAVLSSASIFFFTIPETHAWGSLSIVAALLVAARSEDKPIAERWFVLASAGTLGFTVTNWMVGLIASFATLRWRRAVQVSINAFFAIVVIWTAQKMLLFRSARFFLGSRGELDYVLTDEAGGPLEILRSVFFHSVVMPAIVVTEKLDRPDWPKLTTQDSPLLSAGPMGAAATILWGALLVLGTWAALRPGPFRRVRIVALGSLGGQALLHVLYGEETFLYSLHFLPLLVFVAAFAARTWLRPVVLVIAALLLPLLAVSNTRQLAAAGDHFVRYAEQRDLVREQMRRRRGDPWPRGVGHVVLGFPDSSREDKAYHEPGGGFSPSVGSFGVSLWVLETDGSLRTTGDAIPLADLRQSLVAGAPNAPPGIRTATPYYEATWSVATNHQRILRLVDKTGPGAQLAVVVRSVGPAGAPVEDLRWSDGRLRVGDRWTVGIDAVSGRVEMGSELDPGWVESGPRVSRVSTVDGWAYFRFVMDDASSRIVVTIDDRSPPKRLGDGGYPASTLHVDVPNERFLGSLHAQMDHLLMGLVRGRTRPGEPTNYGTSWIREGSHVVAALARSGYLERALTLAEELLEVDFSGGRGAEADAPGSALWALEEVAARARSPQFDRLLWPHVQRKAALILEMIEAQGPVHKSYQGAASADPGEKTLVSQASRNGLIVGRMDGHRPLLYVNAMSYRGLRDAAAVAERLGEFDRRDAWLGAAAGLEAAWKIHLLEAPGGNPRTWASALWPSEIGVNAQDPLQAHLEARLGKRLPGGAFRQRRLWPYFDFAEAHQWLFVGRGDRAMRTLDWFLDNQASPGLFTWSEGDREVNSSHLWEHVRGWVNPPHVTPHYWVAAEALNLSLDVLAYARPEGSAIVVGAGVPEAWLAEPMEVRGLATRHGVVDWSWRDDKLSVFVASPGEPPVNVGSAFRGRPLEVLYGRPESR